jgi:hypothetical protein
VLGKRHFTTFVAFNALVKVEPQPILDIPTSVKNRHRSKPGLKVIMLDLLDVSRNLAAGIGFS